MSKFNTEVTVVDQVTISNHINDLGIENIRKEIIEGLVSDQKYISSKFFYDSKGSKLFEQITQLPEYYPTRTEKGILKQIATDLMHDLNYTDIVELGSGDCSKINILLDAIPQENMSTINYIPVDVSYSAIQNSAEQLIERFPDLTINGIVADFIHQIDLIPADNQRMFCFLGSTLGNFNNEVANEFILNLSQQMNTGDTFLLGLDLIKPVHILHDAYNDNQGVTAQFNKNILHVVNELIESDMNPDHFAHVAFFNEDKSRIEMHLKAKEDIRITSPLLNNEIILEKGETIHTENSYKFSMDQISDLEKTSGLKINQLFTDENSWFTLILFEK